MRENMNIRCNPFAKTSKNKGFTLMELLVVIAILSILVVAIVPFNGRVQDEEKRDKTEDLLKSLRFALIGDEFAVDAHGNRFIGGYIGDFGALPDLIVHEWDSANKEWDISWETVGSEKVPDVYDTFYANTVDKFNQNAMPLALWINKYIKLEDSSNEYYQEIVDSDTWEGPYITPPRDDYTNDDDLFTYTTYTVGDTGNGSLDNDDVDENRRFWLRQGYGRLTDAWGSALLFYMHEDDLYVVSAGSDRRINYGDYYLWDGSGTKPDYDTGPADLSLSGNEDNLVMLLTKEQWELTAQKVSLTRLMLQDLKKGIVGEPGRYTGGVEYPNGFVTDIGNLETLVGSYVYDEGSTGTTNDKLWKCIKRHVSSSTISLGGTGYWGTVDIDDASTTTITETLADHPYATNWQDGRTYYEAQPQLLLMNADYVYYEDLGETKYYRYINDEDASGKTPNSEAEYWMEDDTFAGHEWVLKYDGSTSYTSEILPTWTYYDTVGFGAGWRGPYTSYTTSGLNDAWGREIVFEMDESDLVLRSRGPIEYDSTGALYEDDDITEIITQREYAVPVTVTVSPEVVTGSSSTDTYRVQMAAADYVTVYSAFNGGVTSFDAQMSSSSSGSIDGTFNFTRADGHRHGPTDVTADVQDGTLVITEGLGAYSPESGYENGVYIPIGKVMVVYRSGSYYSSDASSGSTVNTYYASPHPVITLFTHSSTTDGTTDNTTKYTYQKNVIIQPKTNPTISLGD